MIGLLMLAAGLVDLPGGDPARAAACARLIGTDPVAALAQAQDWAAQLPSVAARQCLGLAFAANGRWTPAALSFGQAADQAQADGDGRAAGLWGQAGNALLAAGEAAKARDALDRALAAPGQPAAARGEVWLDRARADVALDDAKAARSDLDQGLKLVPQDPFAWLLSATLARRQADLARADADIARAAAGAGDDPAVMLEQGNIAWARGRADAARGAWTRAAQADARSPAGQAAARALREAE